LIYKYKKRLSLWSVHLAIWICSIICLNFLMFPSNFLLQ
jgi:hypothetical protein